MILNAVEMWKEARLAYSALCLPVGHTVTSVRQLVPAVHQILAEGLMTRGRKAVTMRRIFNGSQVIS